MDEGNFYLERIGEVVPVEQDVLERLFNEFLELDHIYDSAAKTVETQLRIYDNEFSMRYKRNPIHSIDSRIKSGKSIMGKLQRKGLPMTAQSAQKNLTDIAGIRVVCYYIDDIYAIAELLTRRGDFEVIKLKDYIKNPKPSGYRSFHMVVMVPVYMSTKKMTVPVEIQIRTIAMDFWASLEHQLHYKTDSIVPDDLKEELRELAGTIAETDLRMQDIYEQINEL
ncbi:MAG: GTP pyrophosphokinase family protein [Oscillospiraceae bacterium]|nr:GTP pyrophosphokinase family protein [Oscillospiraceae bacterium]MBR1458500.1 GTP pyrophosphokinase family protein [Oscillospiraceae bacterium]MBR1898908.1 GTP pyrophosphokinase family protein [Oscillospiraceae bacterium]